MLLKLSLPPFIKKFAEITLAVEFLDHAQMAGIVKKIINDFNDEWMRVLFHESDFLENCLLIFLLQELHRILRPFESELKLIMLPDRPENVGKATHSYKMVLVRLIEVGLFALLGTTI
jgi:hypothetical protein